MRLLTVTDLVAIAEQFTPEECKIYFLQTLKTLVADKSWRVRYMIADNFVKVTSSKLLCFIVFCHDHRCHGATPSLIH